MIGEIIKTINCYDRVSHIRNTDKIVEEQPKDTYEIHSCEKVSIWQDKKGMKRYYKFSK